ncbi:MAG: hypothetical protein KDD41_06790 [Flavobacteriales bacterium]|nr:hypothetical protein [Flavobacteriales bacterium]
MKRVWMALSFVAVGCATPHEEKEADKHAENEVIMESETEHHHEHEAIALNNGEKWKVDDNMMLFIRNMEKATMGFEGTDYAALAVEIDENIRSLTSNCTMEGQAHDELHKWLVPFIGLSEAFDVAEEEAEQERIYMEIKAAFEEFNTYFE